LFFFEEKHQSVNGTDFEGFRSHMNLLEGMRWHTHGSFLYWRLEKVMIQPATVGIMTTGLSSAPVGMRVKSQTVIEKEAAGGDNAYVI